MPKYQAASKGVAKPTGIIDSDVHGHPGLLPQVPSLGHALVLLCPVIAIKHLIPATTRVQPLRNQTPEGLRF